MALSIEREVLDDVIDGQISKLVQSKLKLGKATDSISEARENRVANEEEIIETDGQSILNLCKEIADTVVKIRKYSQLKKAAKAQIKCEEDSDVEFVSETGPSTSSTLRVQRENESIIGQVKTTDAHMVTHAKVKPFQCKTCKNKFSTKSDLNVHNLVHIGEWPFNCPTCSKGFYIISHLNRHLASTHQKGKFFKSSTLSSK